jgi:hypothetical protein
MNKLQGNEIEIARTVLQSNVPASRFTLRSIIFTTILHAGYLLVGVIAFGAYEHFKLNGQSGPSLVSLIAAAGFGLAPLRALVRVLLAIEGKVLHLVHGIGGLALGGLAIGGVFSGGPLLSHGALAPFEIMGAAQAIMHQEHPRNAQQAEALRRFATSLPEVEQFANSRDFTSPENVRRAVIVLTDLVSKAQALGATELQSDPGFQSALQRVTTRFGLSLGLDAVDQAIGKLATNPAAANAVPELRKRLAAARKTVEGSAPHRS